MKHLLLASLALISYVSCSSEATPESTETPAAISLLGDPLYALNDGDSTRLANLETAKARFDKEPDSEEAAIWYGRRLAYLDRYSEAIEVYTKALEKHPRSAKLLRHRGHRYLTTRKLVDAIRDLSFAAEIVDALEDEIEPDGLPNARNEPRSTLKFNIWYHLGLAYFFNGQTPRAYSAFSECHAFAGANDDLLCASTNWLYLLSRQINLPTDAASLLPPITLELDVIENQDYRDMLLFYRGHFTAEELLSDTSSASFATRAFGVAKLLQVEGSTDEANDLFLEILAKGPWMSFGYLAAEAELSQL